MEKGKTAGCGSGKQIVSPSPPYWGLIFYMSDDFSVFRFRSISKTESHGSGNPYVSLPPHMGNRALASVSDPDEHESSAVELKFIQLLPGEWFVIPKVMDNCRRFPDAHFFEIDLQTGFLPFSAEVAGGDHHFVWGIRIFPLIPAGIGSRTAG